MDVSRRNFLKGSGLAAGSLALTGKVAQAGETPAEMRTKGLKHTTTICPFCAVGCGMIVHTKDGKIVNIEGDTEHPINQGALCSKGSALFQVANNEHRLTKVQYRAPKSDHWEEKSWDWRDQAVSAGQGPPLKSQVPAGQIPPGRGLVPQSMS